MLWFGCPGTTAVLVGWVERSARPICGRPPACKECGSGRSDRLRSYVRSVVAVTHDRCQDGIRDVSSKQHGGVEVMPLGLSECLTSRIDRSHHLSLFEQAPASVRGDSRLALNWLCVHRHGLTRSAG